MKKAFLLFLMLIIACFTIIGCKDSSNNTNNSSNAKCWSAKRFICEFGKEL